MSTAVERYSAPAGVAEISDRQWKQLERKANIYSRTQLAPERWRGEDKVPDVMAVGLTLHSVGVDLTLSTLNQCYVISGQVQMMAQLQIGIADSHGIDCWFEPDDVSETEATISIRKRGGARVDRYRYTVEMARKNHLLDEWVERWQTSQNGKKYPERVVIAVDGEPVGGDIPQWAQQLVNQGRIKRKDPWFNSRQQMLMARATTLGLKVAAPSVLLGLPAPDLGEPATEPIVVADSAPRRVPTTTAPQDLEEDVTEGEPQDIVDAEIIEGDPKASTDVASEEERTVLRGRIDQLDDAQTHELAERWKTADIPSLTAADLTPDHVASIQELIDGVLGDGEPGGQAPPLVDDDEAALPFDEPGRRGD